MTKTQKGPIYTPKSNLGTKINRKSISKSNADGYAKRQSRRPKTLNSLTSDVYEYTPESTRRSKVTLDLARDEAIEYNVGIDGGNGDLEDLRARLVGENGEDETIESGEDEEIDSDEAFEESDEERFAGFFSAKPSKKRRSAVNLANVDLNEDERSSSSEDEESSEDGEFLDVLDVLDGRAEVDDESDAAPLRHSNKDHERKRIDEDENEEESDEQKSEAEDEDENMGEQEYEAEREFLVSASDSEDVIPSALENLQSYVTGLDPTAKKRKAAEDDPPDRSRKHRRLPLKEQTEAGAENEFIAQVSGSKLNLDDFLAPLASQSLTLQSLKQSTKALDSSKVKTLPAPLPQRAQERLDREAAYEQTKEEVDKWSETMKRIREADHLSFPLQATAAGRVSNLELAAKFKPTTALESSVDALLKSAKLREEDIQETEETMLKMNKLSVEEVAQRRTELRKMRELMFRAEIKAKRISKIKSKTYRKIKRKEREKLGGRLADEEEEGAEGEEARLKREVERARERATLRHKHTGKWARQMRGREGIGEDGKEAIEEMLDRGERLRRKIKGVDSDEQSEDEDDADNTDEDVDQIRQNAFDELRSIDKEDDALRIETDGKGKANSIFEMKFMRDAMARQQQATDELARDFANEIEGRVLDDEASEADETQTPTAISSAVTQRTGGRVSYHPAEATQSYTTATRPIGSLASDTSSVTLKSTDLLSPPQSPLEFQRPIAPLSSTAPSNPWLAPHKPDSNTTKAPKKNNQVVVGKYSSAVSKSKNKIKKLARKGVEEKSKALDDAVVEVSTENILTLNSASTLGTTPSTSGSRVAKPSNNPEDDDNHDEDDINPEVLAQEATLMSKRGVQAARPRAFEQRDLVALAFAGDNVVREFEEAKKREIAADAPREVDTTIAGWGAWGGAGLHPVPPRPQRIKKIAGIDPSSRADHNKANVIISEKRDKKAAKYLVKDLPYPYTSKAQFEKTMERPLGTEWNTRLGFQRGTLPRVVKKPGMIISPLEKM